MGKSTLGIVEKVKVKGAKEKTVLALVDTGAKLCSVDIKLAAETGIGPLKRTTKIKGAAKGKGTRRPVLGAHLELGGRKFDTEVNIADRSHMTFPVLIGRNVLTGNFTVDVEKGNDVFKSEAKRKSMEDEFE